MPPRKIRVNVTPEPEQESDGGSTDSPDVSQQFAEENHQSNVDDASRAVLRAVLAKHMRYQTIRREFVSQTIAATGLRQQRAGFIDEVLGRVNRDLEAIFAYELVVAPVVNKEEPRKKRRTGPSSTTTTSKLGRRDRGGMGLISTLGGRARQVLGRLLTSDADRQVANGRNTNDSQFYLPKHHQTDTPVNNQDLVKAGLTALVVGLVLTSDNHINDTQLVAALRPFGISDSLNHMIPNLDENLMEFLAELVKRDYLTTTGPANALSYSVGSRTFMEFGPRSVIEFMKQIYGDQFDPDTQTKAVVTIERTYGQTLAQLAADELEPGHEIEPGRELGSGHEMEPGRELEGLVAPE